MKKINVFAALLLIGSLLASYDFCFAQNKKKNLDIVFIGNSITHGAGLKDPATEAPPVKTCNYLRQLKGVGQVRFSNQGVSGFTTVDFLPSTNTVFNKVEAAARTFYPDSNTLVFSIMLGTNDSAIDGPNGSPVSKEDYRANMQIIIDRLLQDFPGCKVIIHHPLWYSPNTYNGARYLAEGLQRLQSYFPGLDQLVASYKESHPGQVFAGDHKAFSYFRKHHLTDMQHESGHQGTFYLHPNEQGAVALGGFWARAIDKKIASAD